MSALDALAILHERGVRTDAIVSLTVYYHRWTGDQLTEATIQKCCKHPGRDYMSRVWKATATYFCGIIMHFYILMKEDHKGFFPIDPLHKTVIRPNGEEGYVLKETLFDLISSVDWYLADTVNLPPQ